MIITVTANPAVDKGFHVREIVKNEKLRARAVRRDPGGGGINVSRVIKRLGGETFAYVLAGGSTGKGLEYLLDRERIPFHMTEIEDETRINFTVIEDKTGHQLRFLMPGPKVKEREWKTFLREILSVNAKPQLCVLSGSLPGGVPDDFYFQLIGEFKKRNVRCLLDASGGSLKFGLKAGPYIVKPNLRELGQLVRKGLNSKRDIQNAARLFLKYGCEVVIISLGAKGAMLVTDREAIYAIPPKVKAVSVVGAGDSMVAAIALKIAQGSLFSEVLRFGVAAGTAATLTPGTELCRKSELKRILPEVRLVPI